MPIFSPSSLSLSLAGAGRFQFHRLAGGGDGDRRSFSSYLSFFLSFFFLFLLPIYLFIITIFIFIMSISWIKQVRLSKSIQLLRNNSGRVRLYSIFLVIHAEFQIRNALAEDVAM